MNKLWCNIENCFKSLLSKYLQQETQDYQIFVLDCMYKRRTWWQKEYEIILIFEFRECLNKFKGSVPWVQKFEWKFNFYKWNFALTIFYIINFHNVLINETFKEAPFELCYQTQPSYHHNLKNLFLKKLNDSFHPLQPTQLFKTHKMNCKIKISNNSNKKKRIKNKNFFASFLLITSAQDGC